MHILFNCIGIIAVGLIATREAMPVQSTDEPQAASADDRIESLKLEAAQQVEHLAELSQQMVDMVFSLGELGFQEFQTSRYLTGILRKNGFSIQEGIAGIPTAWLATYGSGKPVISLGSDIDCIPQASQRPGVAYRSPIVDGAPGHGEGHNSGVPLNITAALAIKGLMEREGIGGTIQLWPGVAEEQLGTKAYYVRAGVFGGVDAVLYNHVSSGFGTAWGDSRGNGLVSVEYTFAGASAHSAGAPWRGRSALDAVELMNIGWNFRREHLRIQQRSHYVVTNGGDQPNVVPRNASVWYFFRETTYPRIREMWAIGDRMAEAAAMMTDTDVTSRVLGSAWTPHMNKILAETIHANIDKVGLPEWSEDDQKLAKALQKELQVPDNGLIASIQPLQGKPSIPDGEKRGGGSDDIGDVSWTVPTASLWFPANIAAGPGHSWANAVAMATPIAHKGVLAGAKVQAMTMLDLLLRPNLLKESWNYFRDKQTSESQYEPLIRPKDEPAIWLNESIMNQYRPVMRPYYFDPSRYKTYLQQLGIQYPTVRSDP